MKIEYNQQILDLITYVCANGKAQAVSAYISDAEMQAVAAWPQGLESLINPIIMEQPEVVRLHGIAKEFGSAYVNVTLRLNDAEIGFKIYHAFINRTELKKYAKENQLELPKECDKTGFVDYEGAAKTRVTYRVANGEFEFVLSYERDGFPTSNCKITTRIVTEIACELPMFEQI